MDLNTLAGEFPCLRFLWFQKIIKIPPSQISVLLESAGRRRLFWTQEINNVRKYSTAFQTKFWFNRIYSCLKIFRFPKTYQTLRHRENPFLFWKRSKEPIILDPRKQLFYFCVPKGRKILIPNLSKFENSKNDILCFVINIWYHISKMPFLIDVCLMSMILEISLHDSSGFFCARLFKNWQNMEVHICKHNIF